MVINNRNINMLKFPPILLLHSAIRSVIAGIWRSIKFYCKFNMMVYRRHVGTRLVMEISQDEKQPRQRRKAKPMMSGKQMEQSFNGNGRERRKILVVGKGHDFSREVVDYAIHLAERLDYDILALSVGAGPLRELRDRETFSKLSAGAVGGLSRKAEEKGIHCAHTIKFGDLGSAVEELSHETRRIEFVVADSETDRDEIAREITAPMFSIISNPTRKNEGAIAMAKKNTVAKVIGYGAGTAALYAAIFMNADTVMHYCAKGGVFAALPILTVFAFSFVHGAFSSNVWSLAGIEAMKKDSLHQTEKKVVRQRKQARKTMRAYAYVNPFHRI